MKELGANQLVPSEIIEIESAFSANPFIQCIQEIKALKTQLDGGNDSSQVRHQFYEDKKQLTQDSVKILEDPSILSASVQEKLQLLDDLIPLVSWGYQEAPRYGASNEEEAKEIQDKAESEQRHRALSVFLSSIPDGELNDRALANLLDLEELVKNQHEWADKNKILFEVRQRVVQAVSKMPAEQGKNFLPRLRVKTTPAGFISYDSEWAQILSKWTPEEAGPFVKELVTKIDRDNKDLETVIAQIIEHWPFGQQYYIVSQILTTYGFDDYQTESLFRIMKNWTPEKAEPLLRELLIMPIGSETYADRNHDYLAIAMSNWSSIKVEAFLNDEDNTRWIREISEIRAQEKGCFAKTYEQNYDYLLNGFKLGTLKERNIPFDQKHGKWIADEFRLARYTSELRSAVSIVSKNSNIFTPKIASMMFFDSSVAKEAVDIFVDMPHEKQVEYHSAIADLLMGDDSFSYKELLLRVFNEITQKWTPEEVDDLVIELLSRDISEMCKYRSGRGGGKTTNAINAFELLQSRKTIENHEIIRGILKYSIGESKENTGKAATALLDKIKHDEETDRITLEAAGDAVVMKFRYLAKKTTNEVQRAVSEAHSIATKYNLDLEDCIDKLPRYVQSLVHCFDISNLTQLANFFDNEYELVVMLAETPDTPSLITSKDVKSLFETHLTLFEAEKLKRAGIKVAEMQTEEDFQKMFETLSGVDGQWNDEQIVGKSFRAGAEIFGYKKMFTYIDRRQVDTEHQPTTALALTRHDALHSFEDILNLYKTSGINPEQFFGNILNQVKNDDRAYNEGNAHQHFNAIAATANRDVAGVVSRAQEYRDITRLQELVSLFEIPQQVFASWNNLKRYSELEQMLEKTEILDELKELKTQGKDSLYTYVETLAFHPASKVDMQSVIQFWRDPQSFMQANASHTPEEVHDRKKPSNYVEIPNLDLSAEELRDALVEGKMDLLQAFSALEITYDVPVGGKVEPVSIKDAMRMALGSRKEGVEGSARSAKKLFRELSNVLKLYGLSVQDYLGGKELPEGADIHIIKDLVYHPEFGITRPRETSQHYVARINLKSDPEGVLAGNDTVNCMPFGDGKTTVYTFNPNTAQFLLQIIKDDGTARTIAQSVLTKDIDIGLPIHRVWQQLQEDEHLEEALPENLVRNAQTFIACDNIEVAPNYSKQCEAVIEQIYRDFFGEYVKRFGAEQHLVTDRVIIGEGYSDALTNLPEVPNTYAPQAPVSYSDKTGENVYVLDISKKSNQSAFINRTVRVIKPEQSRKEQPIITPGLAYLTFEDTLSVAYLEGKAYSDNQTLIQYLHNMENCLIAKDINNAAKDRPNLSLKYTDETGKMRGYFLAYEGRLNDDYLQDDYGTENYYGQRAVYLLDLASDRESLVTGGKLINGFVDLYRKNYLDKGDMIPLFMQAREQTSYRIIQRQLDKLGESLGINFELVELPTYTVEEDTMHPIIITPKQRK